MLKKKDKNFSGKNPKKEFFGEKNSDENKNLEKKDQKQEKDKNSGAPSWQEQFLRVNADFQNFKRRVEKEKGVWIELAQREVIKSFLSLVDELDIAIKSSEKSDLSEEMKAWFNGFVIIQKNLHKQLSELGVEQVDSSGLFDPKFHEALMQVDSPDHKSGEIVQVISPGYIYKEKVIRHAKVGVAK